MKRMLAIGARSVVILLIVVYSGDYLLLRYKIAAKGNAFGSVTVYRYYAVQKKANKTEYVFVDSQARSCVHAWFPHRGSPPCWYLTRHNEIQIDI